MKLKTQAPNVANTPKAYDQTRRQGVRDKILDNDRAKGGQPTVGYIGGHVIKEDDPDLHVQDGLEGLRSLSGAVAVGDAGAVLGKALRGVVLLLVGEEAGVERVVREDEEEEEGPGDVDGAGDEVEVLPADEGCAGGDTANKPGEEALEDGGEVCEYDYGASAACRVSVGMMLTGVAGRLLRTGR